MSVDRDSVLRPTVSLAELFVRDTVIYLFLFAASVEGQLAGRSGRRRNRVMAHA